MNKLQQACLADILHTLHGLKKSNQRIIGKFNLTHTYRPIALLESHIKQIDSAIKIAHELAKATTPPNNGKAE